MCPDITRPYKENMHCEPFLKQYDVYAPDNVLIVWLRCVFNVSSLQ